MPPRCCVPGCKTGYSSHEKKRPFGEKKPSIFRPKAENLKAWNEALTTLKRELTLKDRVCSLHFAPECVSYYWEHKGPNGEIVLIPKVAELKRGAVPNIFSHLTRETTEHELPNEERDPDCDGNVSRHEKVSSVATSTLEESSQEVTSISSKNEPYDQHQSWQDPLSHSEDLQSLTEVEADVTSNSADNSPVCPRFDAIYFPASQDSLTKDVAVDLSQDGSSKFQAQFKVTDVLFPGTMWGLHQSPALDILCHVDESVNVDRYILLQQDKARVFVWGREVPKYNTSINSPEDLEKLLIIVHNMNVYQGPRSSRSGKK